MNRFWLGLFVLMSATSHAKVLCIVNGENPTAEHTFDQLIYIGEIAADKPLLIKIDGTVVTGKEVGHEIAPLMAATATGGQMVPPSPKFIEATLVTGRLNEDQTFSLAVGRLRAGDHYEMVDEFMAAGSLAQPLLIVDQHHKLSVYCTLAQTPEVEAPADPVQK